jgi:tetratricopeptide (TPR) repeat protein
VDQESFAEAISVRDAGRPEQALEKLRRMREQAGSDEDRGVLLMNEATCLRQLDNLPAARKALEQAEGLLAGFPSHLVYVNFLLGALASDEGNTEEAIRRLSAVEREADELIANDDTETLARALSRKGAALLKENLVSDAEAAFQRLMSLSSANNHLQIAEYHLGVCLLSKGKVDAALQSFESAARRDVDIRFFSDSHYQAGLIYLQRGHYGIAVQHFEAAEQLPSHPAYVWEGLALAHAGLGNVLIAKKYEQLAARKLQ